MTTVPAAETLPYAQTIWNTNASEEIIYADVQQVAIGLEDPGAYRLAVDGDVKARRVKVSAENWPDYVFEDTYDLRDLENLRNYLQQYGHLPGVPSKEVAEQEGVFVNDMNVILLEKVEELTLYLLQENERIMTLNKALEEERNRTSNRLDDLEKQLEEFLRKSK